jgi:pimeloyl-ACP methyl ester carboxylesterase
VIVAHSLAGLTACGLATAMRDRIRHLVFVSCMIPPEGGRAIDNAPWPLRPVLEWGLRRALAGNGTYRLPSPVARHLFCNDLDPTSTDEVLSRRCPEPAAVVFERICYEAQLADIPKTWVRLRRDKAISTRRQDRMVERLGGAQVVEINSGHDVMIGHPVELAAVLNTVAARWLPATG